MLLEVPHIGEETSDFDSQSFQGGRLWMHVHASRRYKSTTVDLFLPTLLEPEHATGLALLSRLLERGTVDHPDLRALNSYTDWLYGANFFAATQRLGAFQALRLHFAAVDDRFLPQPEALAFKGARLLADVLQRPYAPSGVFESTRVQQEQLTLRNSLAAALSDRSIRAQRRCLELMCPYEPYRLSADGDPALVDNYDGVSLTNLLRSRCRHSVAHLYVCGDVDMAAATEICEHFKWQKASESESSIHSQTPFHSVTTSGAAQRIIEFGDASQGRLIIGHRSPVRIGHTEYPAFLLLNLILGGDIYSRLYRRVREQEGLCYHIASYIEPTAGFLFVEAGIEANHLSRVEELIADELDNLALMGPTAEEMDNARRVVLHRLNGMADHRDALIHFDLQRRLAQAQVDRRVFAASLIEVNAGQVSEVAKRIVRDTTYLLAPDEMPSDPLVSPVSAI